MTKRIVLCADDYGQAPEISQSIITLIINGRLSATSCLVNSPYWMEHAKLLIPFKSQVDIGLHFNLTEGNAISKRYIEIYGAKLSSLPTLLRKAFLRKLDSEAIEAECQAQIDRFTEAINFLPNFIDGHQHVHQFPVIRDVFIRVYKQRLRQQNSYVRWVNEKIKLTDLRKNFKKIVIRATGSNALKKQLEYHHIPHNQSFAGIYSFSKVGQYGKKFQRFLHEIEDGGMIMCHPGLASASTEDVIAEARYEEYQYLGDSQFLMDCYAADVTLNRFA